MRALRSALYVGEVVHARVRPTTHKFRYRVFALAIDVDEIDEIARQLAIFSRNRWNAIALFDRDVGAPGGAPVGEKIRDLLADVELADYSARITLLTYPRMWGYVFNPLSIYFCYDSADRLGATLYEVTNTFRERRVYILKAAEAQVCRKALYVSPFTETPANYSFHTEAPGKRVVVGVTLRDNNGPVLRTHFAGTRRPLTNSSLAKMLVTHPLMTLKVIGAIHFEAARLWRKGVPLVARHTSPAYSFEIVDDMSGASGDAT